MKNRRQQGNETSWQSVHKQSKKQPHFRRHSMAKTISQTRKPRVVTTGPEAKGREVKMRGEELLWRLIS